MAPIHTQEIWFHLISQIDWNKQIETTIAETNTYWQSTMAYIPY